MPSLKFFLGCSAALLLSACSSSNSDKSGPSIRGKLNIAIATAVDSDINDIKAAYTTNNDPQNPQVLNSSILTLQGYVTRTATNGDASQERFANSTDTVDYFRVNLKKGQVITVTAGPVNITSRIIASLIELDADGSPKDNGQKSISNSTREGAQFIAESSATYQIIITASSSASRYVLQLNPALPGSSASGLAGEFISGELLVKNISSGNQRSAQQVSEQYPRLVKLNALSAFTAGKSTLPPLQQWSPEVYQKINTLEMATQYGLGSDVEYAQPNFVYRSQRNANDTFFGDQWPLTQINAPLAWDITTGAKVGGGDVVIAILDTGVLVDQPDLQDNKLVAGYDFVRNIQSSGDGNGLDSNPDDPGRTNNYSFHGTHVAGIAAATSNNSLGMAGVSWDAKIMPVRVLDINGTGSSYSMIQGLRYAARLSNDSGTLPAQAADVINLSLGSTFDAQSAPAEQELFNQIYSAGISVVAAAGNSASSTPFYPASYPTVISVSATDIGERLAPYSNFGNNIDVAAPGGIRSVFLGSDNPVLSLGASYTNGLFDGYNLNGKQGTSMASPHVAGVIALMKAVYPQLTAQQVNNLLGNGLLTKDLAPEGKDSAFGYGLIDALKAVNEAQKLANGGVLPPQPTQLIAEPSSLLIGTNSQQEFTLRNNGGNAPTISVSDDADWLTVTAIENGTAPLTGSTVIRYRAEINRTDLNPGYYKATITVSADGENPAANNIDVYIQVGNLSAQGTLTQQYVLLLSNNSDSAVKTAATDSNGNFVFNNVENGRYRLVGGSDIDVDNNLCEIAETCGFYPLPGVSLIEVNNNDISGIQMPVAIKMQSSLQGRSSKNQSSENQFIEGKFVKGNTADNQPDNDQKGNTSPSDINKQIAAP
ncbi:S8 family serine peptidase [Bacterioplanoides sp.]|uniref:S8 family serine peptidase n=1 Tax=Bacterioplanoides sp. TaxID=2066072 RepID=UPI003B5951C5